MRKTYNTLIARIEAARTPQELRDREKQITRHYENGTITAQQLATLDALIMERLANITL